MHAHTVCTRPSPRFFGEGLGYEASVTIVQLLIEPVFYTLQKSRSELETALRASQAETERLQAQYDQLIRQQEVSGSLMGWTSAYTCVVCVHHHVNVCVKVHYTYTVYMYIC